MQKVPSLGMRVAAGQALCYRPALLQVKSYTGKQVAAGQAMCLALWRVVTTRYVSEVELVSPGGLLVHCSGIVQDLEHAHGALVPMSGHRHGRLTVNSRLLNHRVYTPTHELLRTLDALVPDGVPQSRI